MQESVFPTACGQKGTEGRVHCHLAGFSCWLRSGWASRRSGSELAADRLRGQKQAMLEALLASFQESCSQEHTLFGGCCPRALLAYGVNMTDLACKSLHRVLWCSLSDLAFTLLWLIHPEMVPATTCDPPLSHKQALLSAPSNLFCCCTLFCHRLTGTACTAH